MILELEKGKINVKKNSCENKSGALIYLEFKDNVITNLDTVKLFINGDPCIQISPNKWRLDFTLLSYVDSTVQVIVESIKGNKVYTSEIKIEQYISFGELSTDKFPQAFIDLNSKIKKLEERIKKIEKKKSII